jgi:acyl-CoA dehydrogenase
MTVDQGQGWLARGERVAAVASSHAADVDLRARFPFEAFEALRRERLLGSMVPARLGGDSAAVSDILEVCYLLGRSCAATAMIYAMHQTVVACLVRFGLGATWHETFLARLATDQLLLASSTTEGGRGGDLRSSEAPVEYRGDCIRLERNASCISYGAQADAIVTTARRSAEASPSQQALLVLPRETYSLEKVQDWDTLGMRGTCSAGFILRAEGEPAQVLPAPFDRINAHRQMPVAHLCWSSAWAGVAADALSRARGSVMQAMRKNKGQPSISLPAFTRASAQMHNLRDRIAAAARSFEQAAHNERALESVGFQSEMNLLKVDCSEAAMAIALAALRINGLAGYRNDTEHSVGRHLRDLCSAPLMIHNERILSNMGTHALLADAPSSLGVGLRSRDAEVDSRGSMGGLAQ